MRTTMRLAAVAATGSPCGVRSAGRGPFGPDGTGAAFAAGVPSPEPVSRWSPAPVDVGGGLAVTPTTLTPWATMECALTRARRRGAKAVVGNPYAPPGENARPTPPPPTPPSPAPERPGPR